MRTYSPLFLLAALGLLSTVGPAAAAVDTSEWKCESCPFPKGVSGSVELGAGTVTQESARFGDFNGLHGRKTYLELGGSASVRGANGYFADLAASDLGLDSRAIAARSGHEGLYSLRLGYSELPHYLFDAGATPYLGAGSTAQTLPAGFPAGATGAMPLADSLQAVDLGFKRKRFDLGGQWIGLDGWTFRVALRRDLREGTRPMSGSFFATSTQLVAPLDQATDQLEVAAAYVTRGLSASLAYQISQFRNKADSLTWSNPFLPVVAGSTRGQMALAPDNQLHQVSGSAAYEITPSIRASADFAVGRLTQDAAFLQPTLTSGIAAGLAALPASSLDGRVDTFNGSVRVTAAPLEGLRLNASYARDVRDNRTPVQTYQIVAADVFLDPGTRSNTPFSLTQDRVKLSADYRGAESLRLSAGLDFDNRLRSYVEAVNTRETTAWGRASVQVLESATLAFKLAHAERVHSDYGVATWFGSVENPLLRKYNLADRRRDTVGARADVAISEKVSVGFSLDYANDDYSRSLVGLQVGRSLDLAADLSWALAEQTQLTAYLQGQRMSSQQSGSQAVALPDWSAGTVDRFEVLGLGIRHAAIPGTLDIGADLSFAATRSELAVDAHVNPPPFPATTTQVDSIKAFASYKLRDNLSLNGSIWYEHCVAQDWRLDGVTPSAVPNLLALGQQSPHYEVFALRLGLRYRF